MSNDEEVEFDVGDITSLEDIEVEPLSTEVDVSNETDSPNFSIETNPIYGPAGRGITSIVKTGTSGLVDTYTITYTDGTTSTFEITNGRGITNIAKTGTSGLIDTYTIYYNNGTTSTFTVTNGAQGPVGPQGPKGDPGTTDHTELTNKDAANQHPMSSITGLVSALSGKQETLVSGTNIKTLNNNSLLGSGNLDLDGLPDQTGKNGKFLRTNGSVTTWEDATKVTFREW